MIYNLERPTNFDTMVGQEIVVENIRNQSIRNQFFPVFVLCGQYGSGKTTMARIIAMAANCKEKDDRGNPCGKCDSCRAVIEHSREGIIEIDGASNNGVDNIRALLSQAATIGVFDKKVIVIDEAHMLSKSAFNALLITLENPPSHCIFILCTTEKDALPETVISRAPVYVFGKISDELIKKHILMVAKKNQILISEDAAGLLARYANGAMRNALQLLEHLSMQKLEAEEISESDVVQILGLSSLEERASFLEACFCADTYSIISILRELERNGQSLRAFIQDVLQMNTDLIYRKSGASIVGTKFYIGKLETLEAVSDDDIVQANKMLSKIAATPANYLSLDRIVADVISVIHSSENEIIKVKKSKKIVNHIELNSEEHTTLTVEAEKSEEIEEIKSDNESKTVADDGFQPVDSMDEIPFETEDNKLEDNVSAKNEKTSENFNLFGTGFGLMGGGIFSASIVTEEVSKPKKAKKKDATSEDLISFTSLVSASCMPPKETYQAENEGSKEIISEPENDLAQKEDTVKCTLKDSIPPNEEEEMTWDEAAECGIVPERSQITLPVPESDEELEEKYYPKGEDMDSDGNDEDEIAESDETNDGNVAREELARLLKSSGFRVIYKKARMVDKDNQIYLYFENMGYVMAAKALLAGCKGIIAELDKH